MQDCTRWHSNIYYYLIFSEKIRLGIICESSAAQHMIHMKYQALFSLKNNKKKNQNINYCSCDYHFNPCPAE